MFKFLLVLIAFFRIISFSNTLPEGKEILIKGQILKEVITYEKVQKIEIEGHRIYLPKYPTLNYGQKVVVKGLVLEGEIKNPELVEVVDEEGIFKIRNKLIESIGKALPTRHAALVAGVVLGSKKYISREFWADLVASGTAHVVVASGTNVVLTASFLINILIMFTSRRKAIPIALAGIWFYVLMSGFDAPLVRAAIMGSVAFSAQAFGRVADSMLALTYSAVIMVIVNPLWIADVGFQLSLMATLSLILFEPRINKLIYFIPNFFKQDLSTSLAAQVGVAPLLFIYFDTVNILSPLVNMLILWTIVPIMILGAVAMLTSLFLPNLASLIYLLIYPFSFIFLYVVELFS